MRRLAKYGVVLTLLVCFVVTSVEVNAAPRSQEAPDSGEPWAYLWHPRTLHLYELTKDVIELGRLTTADVVVAHPLVSRRHLEIRRTGTGAVVVDLRSTNGSHLNRRSLRAGQETPLHGGDLIALADEELIFEWTRKDVFEDALHYALLAQLIVLRVPVLQDRTLRALGQEREILGLSEAEIDLQQETIHMSHGNETQAQAFEPGEKVFVGDAVVAGGAVLLSLWGIARDAPLQSRRAIYSNLVHGQLSLRIPGASRDEAGAALETQWADLGMQFLTPILYAVMDSDKDSESGDAALGMARGLTSLESATALHDGARCLGYLAQLNPADSELPAKAALAEARWVKAVAETHKAGIDEAQRKELVAALERGKGLVRTAGELGADGTEEAEAEIVEAEGILVEIP